jgi:hypothetical protein
MNNKRKKRNSAATVAKKRWRRGWWEKSPRVSRQRWGLVLRGTGGGVRNGLCEHRAARIADGLDVRHLSQISPHVYLQTEQPAKRYTHKRMHRLGVPGERRDTHLKWWDNQFSTCKNQPEPHLILPKRWHSQCAHTLKENFGTGVWIQGLYLELFHQPFFVMGFFKIRSHKLFARPGFEPWSSWSVSSWDHRHEPAAPTENFGFFKEKQQKLLL